MRTIACIEAAEIIEKILTHLDTKAAEPEATTRPPWRAPPQRELFECFESPDAQYLGLRHQRRGWGGGSPGGREQGIQLKVLLEGPIKSHEFSDRRIGFLELDGVDVKSLPRITAFLHNDAEPRRFLEALTEAKRLMLPAAVDQADCQPGPNGWRQFTALCHERPKLPVIRP